MRIVLFFLIIAFSWTPVLTASQPALPVLDQWLRGPIEGEIRDARPKKVDIDKMHAYRDAIRMNDERVVTYAAILFPGPPAPPFGSGVEAISAVPGGAEPLDVTLGGVLEKELA